MEFIDIIKSRSSIKSYKNKKIERDILANIVDCARLAPSANNLQPWEFIVVTEKDKLKELSELIPHGKFINEAAACIVVCSKDTKYYLEDCSAATENILLAAHSYGIGSCWIAVDKHDYEKDISKILKVPKENKIVSMVSLGYPSEEKNLRPIKRGLKNILHWEVW